MKEIGTRFHQLVLKLLSVKGLILGLATWLLVAGMITESTWVLAAGSMAGIRAIEKKIAKQQGGA